MKHYNDIIKEREARRQAEMTRGYIQVKIEKLMGEMDPKRRFTFQLISNGTDIRSWQVVITLRDEISLTESFFDFPTNELKTKMMLLGA